MIRESKTQRGLDFKAKPRDHGLMKRMKKEKIIAQFVANSKSSGPATKNHHLRTVYKLEFEDGDGDKYYSDSMANSEGTY